MRNQIEYWLSSAFGAFFVPAFNFLYGTGEGRYIPLFLVFLLLIMDWVSGTSAAKKDGIYASEYGIEGLKRTAYVLLIPAVGHLIDRWLGTPDIAFGLFTGGLIYNLLKSVTANHVRAGWDRLIPTSAIEWAADEIEHKISRANKRRKEKDQYLDGEKK